MYEVTVMENIKWAYFLAKFLDGKDANEQKILIRGYEATAMEEYIFTKLSRFGGGKRQNKQ